MSEWIKWEGGECPVYKSALVNVRFRRPKLMGHNENESNPAGSMIWNHVGNEADIVEYRLANAENSVADNDGWVLHYGIDLPLPNGTYVLVKRRGGASYDAVGPASVFSGWIWRGSHDDIISYKISHAGVLEKADQIAAATELTGMLGEPEYTGASVSYYKLHIKAPVSGQDAYMAECQDIIEVLGMDFNEANAFKALWRRAAARTLGKTKKGYDGGLYDAEKVLYAAQRLVALSKGVKS